MITIHKRFVWKNNSEVPTVVLPRDYRLQFAAGYAYSPKGKSEASVRSRQLCERVKKGSQNWIRSYVTCLRSEVANKPRLCRFFPQRTLLVPVPNSPLSTSTPASGWVARSVALALKEAGLAEDVWIGLRRTLSVEKSAAAWMWERPTVLQHFLSFDLDEPPRTPTDIVLVDDVITKGRTLLAAAIKLQESFPNATIRGFALVRTMGFVLDIERVFDPCEGVVRWNGEDAYREP